jgi:hypothetical protein
LTAIEIDPLKEELQKIADEEFSAIAAVEKIEKLNKKAARSQELLNYVAISSTLRARQRTGTGDEMFWREISQLEETIKNHEALHIPKIPVESTKYLEELLFDVTLPQVGTDGHMKAPPTLIKSSIEAACRLAESMKVKRAEMTTERFLGRAERELRRRI